ncbi:unnamed protein product [Arctia plantaginis]|uniref:Pentatricopeptide repeat-containing protein-mitochondrial domain-containing protein n=1 Tax=Arctia plantaginis TaxID=874455 RepID=A0A8S1BH21_ARCPL|nr:unnamed protein product [Arctia plantaginis]
MLTRHYVKIASYSKALIRNNIVINRKYENGLRLHNLSRNIQLTRSLSTVRNKSLDITTNSTLVKTPNTNENKMPAKSPVLSSEEVLEKFMANLNTDIHQKNRVYRNDFMRVLVKVKELNFSTKKQGLLLIRCCGELMPDESPPSRMALVEQVWTTIMPHTKFEIEHYNELLKVYIANNRTLTASSFLTKMAPILPTDTTYELILRALGEAGDLNQATEVISNMKSQGLPANEHIFNSLIICQGKLRNTQNIQEVLSMMKSLKINPTVDTYTAISRALAFNKEMDAMIASMSQAIRLGFRFTEVHIMEIVKTLSAVACYAPIPQVLKYLPAETLRTPSISPYMQSVTTMLVFQNHPIAALEIYKCLPLPSFGPKDDRGLHGRSLVRDCVKAAIPSSIIGFITQDLMSTGRNTIALQNAAEAALQLGKTPLALDMLTRMKQIGLPIRAHYFWPIMLHNAKTYGEKGIINTLVTMVQMDVSIDYETIMEYTLPFVSFTSPQNLMKKFLEAGLSMSTVLTPMMVTLLVTGQVRAASELCELFQGKVDAEKLLQPLLKGYLISADVKSTVHALEDITAKASDKNKDWVGRFLCKFMEHKKIKEDISDIVNLMKRLTTTSLRISTIAGDYCIYRLPDKYNGKTVSKFRDYVMGLTDERVIDDGDVFDQQMSVHPKQMNEESLRAHLVELEAKGMNTRGVLRKLLQQYCRDGNLKAARDIATKCQNEGMFLSAGMKAAIFDLHVKLGELDLAEIMIADLNKTSPNFNLDEFKVIDFATLMVYKKQIQKAFNLIHEQSKKRKVKGGRSITMNCWRLLDATAAQGTERNIRDMFDLLIKYNYCKPSNVLLGPLVRVHLKSGNIDEAVDKFEQLAEEYSKTPLKHELLCKILHSMGDGHSEDIFINLEKSDGKYKRLVQRVLEIDRRVHGPGDVQLTLIAALADVNYKKTLRKMLLDPSLKFHPDALKRRCERFADEKKTHALENIAECARDLRHIDVEEIYELILDVHIRNDDFVSAKALWIRMQEADIIPSKKFVDNLWGWYKSSNRDIPTELSVLINKQAKKVTKG